MIMLCGRNQCLLPVCHISHTPPTSTSKAERICTSHGTQLSLLSAALGDTHGGTVEVLVALGASSDFLLMACMEVGLALDSLALLGACRIQLTAAHV